MMKVVDRYLAEDSKLAPGDFDANKRINIDFDGVVHAYSKGFHDGTIYDKPQEGVEEALKLLKSKGFELILFTARINAEDNGKQNIIDWLKKYNLSKYFSDITDQKKPSKIIIDDSAVRHNNWAETINNLKTLNII